MRISTGYGNKVFTPKEVATADELSKVAVKKNYSCAVFKDRQRNLENFEQAECIGLDFDDGMTLEDAKVAFAEYKHLIMPTRNHGKEKNGVTCDRFRVILFLSKPITDVGTYYQTWFSLQEKYPAMDPACKDPSRLYYPSREVASVNEDGALVDPVPYVEKPKFSVVEPVAEVSGRGEISKRTLKFLFEGAPGGKRHGELYAAARDLNEQGFSKEDCILKVEEMIKRTGNWGTASINENDLATIEDAFSREPRHDPRNVQVRAFDFRPAGELLEESTTIEWLVEDLLEVGGLSVVAGLPKSGKSTLVRQLARSVCRGEHFLGRGVRHGSVAWLALEESRRAFNKNLRVLGILPSDPLYVHVGGPRSKDPIHDLDQWTHEIKPALVVVDTLALLAGVKSLNDYAEVNAVMSRIRDIARINNTHVLLIHHANKGGGYGTNMIHGSGAIHGAVDTAILFNQENDARFISTSQREGRPIYSVEAVFDAASGTYSLGKKYEPQKDEF